MTNANAGANANVSSLETRIKRLEDRAEIGELIARYCFSMDNRDIDVIHELFTPDVVIRSVDGIMNAAGIDAVMDMFRGRFKVLGPSNHFTHDRELHFDHGDPDAASGLVSSHAEMHRLGTAMITAIRYEDVYRRHAGRWRFKERALSFFYYLPTDQYLQALQNGKGLRMRAYNDERAADWPESLSTWKKYYG